MLTVGDPSNRGTPDLAIEVIWTHGSIDKLEFYRGLGVPEVWFWQDGRIAVHLLDGDRYRPADRSALLPDLEVVAGAVTLSPREARAALRASYR